MDAGRELDALVAEHVMGWKRVDVPKDYDGQNAGVTLLPATPSSIGWDPKGAYALWHFCPYYSTDIAAAWLVVEKLVNEGKVFIVKGDGLRTGDYPLKWTVLCDNQPRTDANTAPLAICLAALKAVSYQLDRKEPNS